MIEDICGNYWVVRVRQGIVESMGWDADGEELVSDWVPLSTEDIIDYCRFADGGSISF